MGVWGRQPPVTPFPLSGGADSSAGRPQFKCDTRSLSNFIDALSARNNQTGGAEVRSWGPHYAYRALADGNIYTFPDFATYDFTNLDIC